MPTTPRCLRDEAASHCRQDEIAPRAQDRPKGHRLYRLLPNWLPTLDTESARECNRSWAQIARRRQEDEAELREARTRLGRGELKVDPMWA